MPIIYEEADDETRAVMTAMLKKHHHEISGAGVTIGIFMATPETDEAGNPKSPAVALNGYPCAAKIKINSYPDRVQGKPDATIFIDAEEWNRAMSTTNEALMDHELHHLEVRRDPKTGVVKRDDLGRPKLKMRKHDHQFGWFNVIAKRHGDASYEIQQARKFADRDGQLYFGWKTPPGCGETPTSDSGKAVDQAGEPPAFINKATAKAMKELVAGVGKADGFTSIEMSTSGGKSVVIDADAAKRIRKNADAIISGK